jgi:hypothetical protein
LSVIVTVVLLAGATAFWGSRAGIDIIRKKQNEDLVGIKTSFLILFTLLVTAIPFDLEAYLLRNDPFKLQNLGSALLYVIALWTILTKIYGMCLGTENQKIRSLKKFHFSTIMGRLSGSP